MYFDKSARWARNEEKKYFFEDYLIYLNYRSAIFDLIRSNAIKHLDFEFNSANFEELRKIGF